ncbi:hypothetical protein [Pseudomonas sp. UBA7530]|uniref:hypothetical protein n=1 Tax=Pseudomonas sp. UBA7530 TaxID=1947341 RepID=UPI0025FA4087|nr:hypothetical protein [Pseudomonas sp. UBA7530]
MSDPKMSRESPLDELDLILRAYQSLGALSDSPSYDGEVVGSLIRELNKRFADELSRIETSNQAMSFPPLRGV